LGRAGRDGLPSTCVLLFNYADKNTHDFFIEGSYPDISTVKNVYAALLRRGEKRIELTTAQIGKLSGEKNEMSVQSALYMLERAGHISREAPAARGVRAARAICNARRRPLRVRCETDHRSCGPGTSQAPRIDQSVLHRITATARIFSTTSATAITIANAARAATAGPTLFGRSKLRRHR
jgi:hypothetical protein